MQKMGILSSLPSPAFKHFTSGSTQTQPSSTRTPREKGDSLKDFPPSSLPIGIICKSTQSSPHANSFRLNPDPARFLHGRYPQRNFSYFIPGVGTVGWEGFPAADSWISVFSAALAASRAKYRDSALS